MNFTKYSAERAPRGSALGVTRSLLGTAQEADRYEKPTELGLAVREPA